jgi:hypothetical protein
MAESKANVRERSDRAKTTYQLQLVNTETGEERLDQARYDSWTSAHIAGLVLMDHLSIAWDFEVVTTQHDGRMADWEYVEEAEGFPLRKLPAITWSDSDMSDSEVGE